MFWTMVWFIVNSFFVASLIVYLFVHRSYTMAKHQSVDSEKMKPIANRRRLAGVLTILLFAGMVTSFIINMLLNG